MFESYTQPFQYLIIERVLENNETKQVKVKKESMVSMAELMQYNIHNQLEFIKGENSNEIIEDTSSYFSLSYDFRWYINGPHRIGVDCQIL